MASEQKQDRSSLTGVVAIVLAVGAFAWFQAAPLDSSRPPPPGPLDKTPGVHQAEARLWEDPLEAVQRHVDKSKDAPGQRLDVRVVGPDGAALKLQAQAVKAAPESTVEPLSAIFKTMPTPETADHVRVIAVMLSGSPYAEAAEVRRRTRYAVVSALLRDYFPQDPDKLHYAQYRIDPGKAGRADPAGALMVPYEWYEGDRTHTGRRIAVLWLNDSRLGSQPLSTLNALLRDLKRGYDPAKLSLKVIGPPDSGRLQEMAGELSTTAPDYWSQEDDDGGVDTAARDIGCVQPRPDESGSIEAGPKRARFELIAAHPTSEPQLWEGRAEVRLKLVYSEARQNIADDFWDRCGVLLTRAVAPDYALVEALLRELKHRGFRSEKEVKRGFDRERQRIAIVTEADTKYGRYFPAQFREALGCDESNLTGCPVEYFSYLRGLDGQTAHEAAKARLSRADQKSDKGAADKSASRQALERADGNAQQDYLIRLADTIRRANRRAEREERGEITAIGVLGSDVYDKLLVLRALRQQFPKALFFTTDLDARLLHRDEIPWTRNLVVASSFGFELHPGLQGHAPPFRDNYQTASFLAAVLAIDKDESRDKSTVEKLLAGPRIFELGQTRPFDLVALDQRRRDLPACSDIATCEDLHPAWTRPRPRQLNRAFAEVALAILCAAVLAYYFSVRTRGAIKALGKWRALTAFGMVIALVYLVVDALMTTSVREPWSLTEGVSIWPSVILRTVALILGCYYLLRVFRMAQASEERIARRFGLQDPSEIRSKLPLLKHLFDGQERNRMRITRFGDECLQQFPRKESHELVPADRLWHSFIVCGTPRMSISRALPLTLIGFMFCGALFRLFDTPGVPYRGDVNHLVYIAVLFAGVWVFLLLTFVVVDMTKLTQRMINQLSAGITHWSTDRPTFAEPLGLDCAAEREWMDLKFIAEHTAATANIIYFPAIVLFIFIAARHSALDNFDLSVALTLVLATSGLMAVACAIMVRTAAEKARTIAVERISDQVFTAKAEGDSRAAAQLELLLQRIENLREGAFAPYTQQPVLRAFLLPLGGLGGAAVLESLALFGV